MVRLENLADVAKQFVLVRLTRIDQADLGLFQFDYDLTLAFFFLNAQEQIYGRYGGRDARGPDTRQSLAGLRNAMLAALRAHRQRDISAALQRRGEPLYIRDLPAARNYRGCIHCHQAKEILYDSSTEEQRAASQVIFRYPLPDNLGFVLDIDQGNVVQKVLRDSAASRAGLRPADTVLTLNGLPVHSIADAQFALDRSPVAGSIDIRWLRQGKPMAAALRLPAGWRKSDLRWRPSMRYMVPSARVFGRDLTPQERSQFGLTATQLAFWQKYPVSTQAQDAGVQEEDIILGFDGKVLEMEAYDFLRYVERNYLVGDRVQIDIIRDGQRIQLPMRLR